MGLAELPCTMLGVIFACLTLGKPLDLDNWLGEFAEAGIKNWIVAPYTERLSVAG